MEIKFQNGHDEYYFVLEAFIILSWDLFPVLLRAKKEVSRFYMHGKHAHVCCCFERGVNVESFGSGEKRTNNNLAGPKWTLFSGLGFETGQ